MTKIWIAAGLALAIGAGQGVRADVDPKTEELFEAMGLPEVIVVMRAEGISYGEDIATDLFPGRAGAEWTQIVSDIYDAEALTETALAGFDTALDGADVQGMIDFFRSDLGRQVVGLEVSARELLLDDDLEAQSQEAAALAMRDDTPRFQLLERFVAANDLIETNVVGAMNSSYAFYVGLSDGGGFPQALTEDQILSDVWSQEPEIRANTTEWVYSFLMLAYQPLSDAQIETYITFSESEAGQELNDALFFAFDGMFNGISRDLGLGASRFMVGQDL